MNKQTTTAGVEKLCPLSTGKACLLKIFPVAEMKSKAPNNQLVKSAGRKRMEQLVLSKAFQAERAHAARRPGKELPQDRKVESQTRATHAQKLSKKCTNSVNSKHMSLELKKS